MRVLHAAQPRLQTPRLTFAPLPQDHPGVLALRPLVSDILHAYGNPLDDLAQIDALRDWVARNAVHPYASEHPAGYDRGLTILPAGVTWADYNAVIDHWQRVEDDNVYWTGRTPLQCMDDLLGVIVDPQTGERDGSGMLERVDRGRYRIRSLSTYRGMLCSHQHTVLVTLLAAAGYVGSTPGVIGHTPAAAFVPSLGRWTWQCATFNESFALPSGERASPLDMLAYSRSGRFGDLVPVKTPGPTHDPLPFGADNYLRYAIERALGLADVDRERAAAGGYGVGMLNNHLGYAPDLAPPQGYPMQRPAVQDHPDNVVLYPALFSDPAFYVRTDGETLFPAFGCGLLSAVQTGESVTVRLTSNWPGHVRYERRIGEGPWEAVAGTDTLAVGTGRVEYRSVDGRGGGGMTARLIV